MQKTHDQGDAKTESSVVEVDVRNAYGGNEYAGLEKFLCGLPGP